MVDNRGTLKEEMNEISEMITHLASVELGMHDEIQALSIRMVRVRETLRQMHAISVKLGDQLSRLEARWKKSPDEGEKT
jgi:hypothetical protein